jgi:aspartyl aminopeptidase
MHPLCEFIDASPSPFHACGTVAGRLDEAGYTHLAETDSWAEAPERAYLVRGGSLVAWDRPSGWHPPQGFRIVGAHTDSPNLRLKPNPDTGTAGYRQLGIEVYGGVLLNSWLDRDLGLSGRVTVRGSSGQESRLLRVDRPLLRIPQLAIHLDREITERGLKLDRQTHLTPLWGLGMANEGEFTAFAAKELGVVQGDVLAFDVMTHDLTPSTVLGVDDDLISAPRIDNLASCWAGLEALLAAPADRSSLSVLCLYDHEEVGSQSSRGADSGFLAGVLERLALGADASGDAFHRATAASRCVSADGAHATNPNYVERHDPEHRVAIGAGPVIKHNANERYATDSESAAWFTAACERSAVPVQQFVSRSDMPCGSTIGPVTAARLGVPTVDVGIPQLAMHSARELCGTADPDLLVLALTACLSD